MAYLAIKHLHIVCVILSISGFCLRGLLLMQKSALAGRRVFKILPHVNDSLLLAAALWLMVQVEQYPFIDTWLTAKVFGLIAYIILGAVAFSAQRPARMRLLAGLGALLTFSWIVSVALTKNPWGWLA
ncbi:SirB2 family protein [Rhodocyclaceae bacterium]